MLTAAGLLVVGTVLYSAYQIMERTFGGNAVRPIAFDSAIWKASPRSHTVGPTRQRIVDDLLRSHPLVGLTRDEVEALIGPPEDTAYFRNYEMVYLMGNERGMFGIDSEWLVIKLDNQHRVIEAQLATD